MTLYLATVKARLDGDLRDVRISPESPAPRPDELFNSAFAGFSLIPPFFSHLAGNGPPRGPFHPPFTRTVILSGAKDPSACARELRDPSLHSG